MATITGASKSDLFLMAPESLTLITDSNHPLYDPRIEMELDENLVRNIMVHGVIEPVIARRNGESIEVVDGRQRTRAAMEANTRLVNEGKPEIRVPVVLRRGKDADLFGVSISANELRTNDEILMKADKALRLLNMGKTEKEIAIMFGVTVQAVEMWLSLQDVSEAVRYQLEMGNISATAAWQLSKLSHDKQDEELDKLLQSGEKVTVSRVRSAVNKTKVSKRIRAKKEIQELFDSTVEKIEGTENPDEFTKGYLAALEWVLNNEGNEE